MKNSNLSGNNHHLSASELDLPSAVSKRSKGDLQAIDWKMVALLASRLSRSERIAFCEHVQKYGRDLSRTPAAIELFGLSERLGREEHELGRKLVKWEDRGYLVCAFGEPEYPTLLANIFDPPLVLFIRGQISCLREPTIAIVGSRRSDQVSNEVAAQFGQALAERGCCIVSGLAYGIDGAAHRGALQAGGESRLTVAVIGQGFGELYPRQNQQLANEIVEAGGAIVSQFEPGHPALPSNFLNRNRVIAGLSQAVLVVQAAARSGSLATARHALEEGRELLAVPGGVLDSRYHGSNKLIQQGAYLVQSVDDLIAYLPQLKLGNRARGFSGPGKLSEVQTAILEELHDGARVHIDQLGARFPNLRDLELQLLELETGGAILRLPGNMIAAAPRM